MVNKSNKLWARFEQLKTILGIYIVLFFVIPFGALSISCLVHQAEIDAAVQDAVKIALLKGLKWYAIIMPIVTVLFVIWLLCYSSRVELTDNSILFYRWIFSKRAVSIPYDEITDVVFNEGLWRHRGSYECGRKILIYNRNAIILKLDLYYKLCLSIALVLRDKKIRLVDDNLNLKAIDNYFKIDFMNLSYDSQQKLLKYYCKTTRVKYKTGEEILNK